MASDGERVGTLVHAALFYRDDVEYLDATLPFITDGVDQSEPVFVAVPTAKLALLRAALGDVGEQVTLSDMAEVGRNPARTFAEFTAIGAQHPGRRMRMLGEPVWPGGRGTDEYPACVQNEALWNTAFADWDLMTLCPYDAAGLPQQMLADARMTHPLIWQDGSCAPSRDYSEQQAFARYNQPLPADPAAVSYSLSDVDDLEPARAFAARYAESIGLGADRIGDLQLIVSELATNSLKYTPGGCRLSLWQHDGVLICQVSDTGHLADPLAGRRLPDAHAAGGRGLYLVNALADLVRIHTSVSGTTIQAHLRLDR